MILLESPTSIWQYYLIAVLILLLLIAVAIMANRMGQLSENRRLERKSREIPARETANSNLYWELEKLRQMLDDNTITYKEFEQMKAKVLNR